MTGRINSSQELLRHKNQLGNDIRKLEAAPQTINSLTQRIKNNESGSSQEIRSIIDDNKQLVQRININLTLYNDPHTNQFATNQNLKKQDYNQFKQRTEFAIQAVLNAEKTLMQAEKESMKRQQGFSQNRQLVDFGDDNIGNTGFAGQQQKQASVQKTQEMMERERAMQQIERDIENVNMIYKELNTLVHQQADHVESIADHIDNAEIQVEEGVGQLQHAAVSSRNLRKKKLCLTIFCIVAVLVLIFVIWISLKN